MISCEKDLDRKLTKILKAVGTPYRVENHAINGMPDFYLMSDCGFPYWVENKVVKSGRDKIKFRAGQQTFLEKNDTDNVKSFVLVYNKGNKVFYLFSGKKAHLLGNSKFEVDLNEVDFLTDRLIEVIAWQQTKFQKPHKKCKR